jgi:hypothetical protein
LGDLTFAATFTDGSEGLFTSSLPLLLPGDYNDNNVIDTADYVVWRKNNNTAVTLPNDSTPGTSPADYDVWRANFGQTTGSGSGATASSFTNASSNVPEPASLLLLVIGCAAIGLLKHRR